MATAVVDQKGTKATAKFVRMSASKARIVLDLIRGKHVAEAQYILEFSERLASEPIAKVLRSAIANAQHNDELSEDELYISECYADMGPTLKRFRPRARGRAGRIQKKTCHITVVVSRLTDEELDARREQEERKAESSPAKKADSASRRKRVAKSKAADAKDEAKETPQDTVTEDVNDASQDAVNDDNAEDTAVESAASEEEE